MNRNNFVRNKFNKPVENISPNVGNEHDIFRNYSRWSDDETHGRSQYVLSINQPNGGAKNSGSENHGIKDPFA